jgi:hypothetical protein
MEMHSVRHHVRRHRKASQGIEEENTQRKRIHYITLMLPSIEKNRNNEVSTQKKQTTNNKHCQETNNKKFGKNRPQRRMIAVSFHYFYNDHNKQQDNGKANKTSATLTFACVL